MKPILGSALFTEVTRACKVAMSYNNQRFIMPSVATNINATNMNLRERQFGDDSCCSEPAYDTKTFDAVLFDILQIPVEDIANQLTLIDLPLFQAITPDELTCCEWAGKKKHELCPNVVRFTKRFNQVSFWVTKEILSNKDALRRRADIVTYFIRVSSKLLDLNNLNSLKAVVSSLNSAPIFRLTQTWNLVPKREKDRLERLQDLTSEEHNYGLLRSHLASVKAKPCIPYLGIYLTDLTYINTIHPYTGGLDKERTQKMNEILRIIADFQILEYSDFVDISYIQNYLTQLKYIDELQKFEDDNNYKLSLLVEPNASTQAQTMKDAAVDNAASESHELLFPPSAARKSARPKHLSRTFRSPSPDKKQYTPGHRKAKSLGSTQQFLQAFEPINGHGTISSSKSHSPGNSNINLLDGSPVVDPNLPSNSDSDQDDPEIHPIVFNERRSSGVDFVVEGFLKRKTFMKNGSKPSVSVWSRFWVGLSRLKGELVYFNPRVTWGAQERVHFKLDSHKSASVFGWTVFLVPDTDIFHLTDSSGHTVYHFKAGSARNANIWCTNIKVAAEGFKVKAPTNLIDFGDTLDRTVIRDTHL